MRKLRMTTSIRNEDDEDDDDDDDDRLVTDSYPPPSELRQPIKNESHGCGPTMWETAGFYME